MRGTGYVDVGAPLPAPAITPTLSRRERGQEDSGPRSEAPGRDGQRPTVTLRRAPATGALLSFAGQELCSSSAAALAVVGAARRLQRVDEGVRSLLLEAQELVHIHEHAIPPDAWPRRLWSV